MKINQATVILIRGFYMYLCQTLHLSLFYCCNFLAIYREPVNEYEEITVDLIARSQLTEQRRSPDLGPQYEEMLDVPNDSQEQDQRYSLFLSRGLSVQEDRSTTIQQGGGVFS